MEIELDGIAAGPPQDGLEGSDHARQVVWLRLHRVLPRKTEKLLVERAAARHRVLHGVEQAQMRRLLQLLFQEHQPVADDVQNVVEVVRNAAGQLADGIQLLRLEECFTGEFERLAASLRSVMSRVILAKPTSPPASSRMASITTCAKKRVPSLRTRAVGDRGDEQAKPFGFLARQVRR
jgi:hypothetical protein